MEDLLGGFSPSPAIPAASAQSANDFVEAVFDYEGLAPGELSFKIGERILVTERLSTEIWTGSVNGKSGSFPAMHVQSIDANATGEDDVLGKALQSESDPTPVSAGLDDNLFGLQSVASPVVPDEHSHTPTTGLTERQVTTPATTPEAAVAAAPPATNVKFADEVGLVVDDGGAGGRRPFQDDPEWYLTQLVNALPASKG
jgi:hypothetical protein